jgi:predicted GH43/DUF377 family glycosyl hydrolase
MINVQRTGKILAPTNLGFETKAVLNPAIYQEGQNVHVVYRAVDNDGISSLGYARLDGPINIAERWDKPFMYPKLKTEKCGIEDPRLVKIGDTIYMTYVVHDGKNAISAFSYGNNLFNLKKGHIISPKIPYREAGKIFSYSKLKDEYYFFQSFYQEYGGRNVLIWHKDCILFPEKIDNNFLMLHRILPDIQLLKFEDFENLKDKYFWIYNLMNLSKDVLLEGEHGFESRHVGGGCPPIKTEAGWLMIYHSAQEFNKKRVYFACAALLDLNDPSKIIARLPYPLISPQADYEQTGMVNNVVFPTGTAQFGDDLYIYYGAADNYIAAAFIDIKKLIAELLNNKTTS